MLFANAARGMSTHQVGGLDLPWSFHPDPALLLPHDMNPQTSRGLCFTLQQSFTPQRQPGHPQQDPHSGCQLITNRSNFHIGSHFLCDASLHRPDLPIGWSVLVDSALLPPDFARTQASGQHQPKPYLCPLPGITERHQHDSCLPPAETILSGERVEG